MICLTQPWAFGLCVPFLWGLGLTLKFGVLANLAIYNSMKFEIMGYARFSEFYKSRHLQFPKIK